MKLVLLILGCFSFLSAAEADFSKVFPKEKLFNESKIGKGRSYTYLTDSEFKDLEKQLIEFLGDHWKNNDADDEIKDDVDLAAIFEKQGMELKGMLTLTRKDDPKAMVMLQLIEMKKMKLQGKRAILTLTVMNMEEAEGEEEEPESKEPKKEETVPKEQSPTKKLPTGGVLKDRKK